MLRVYTTRWGALLIATATAACGAEAPEDTDGTELTEDRSQEINGKLTTRNCNDTQAGQIQAAIDYLHTRVGDGHLAFKDCLAEAFLYWNRIEPKSGVAIAGPYDGWSIANMYYWNYDTVVECRDLDDPNDPTDNDDICGHATRYFSTLKRYERLTLDPDCLANFDTTDIAAVIAHEVAHNRGFADTGAGTRYGNTVSLQVHMCIDNWVPNPPRDSNDNGYVFMLDGEVQLSQPSYTRTQAQDDCAAQQSTYTGQRVDCYYGGKRLGYELYWNLSRAGFAPKWNRSQAVDNCTWNKTTHTNKKVECLFDGKRVGYELYWDGVRVGYEPGWTRAQGQRNCESQVSRYPNKKVQCTYDGDPLGYELLFDGRRVGYRPEWSQSQGQRNCDRNDSRLPDTVVECLYNGQLLCSSDTADDC